MKFRIICETDSYHARLSGMFSKGETEVTIDEFDTLKEANEALLGYLNETMGCKRFPNWGLACACKSVDAGSYDDGTKYFRDDVYTWYTEQVERIETIGELIWWLHEASNQMNSVWVSDNSGVSLCSPDDIDGIIRDLKALENPSLYIAEKGGEHPYFKSTMGSEEYDRTEYFVGVRRDRVMATTMYEIQIYNI